MADQKPLTVYVLTFNCARRRVDPAALARDLFTALPADQPLPDILAVSLQEVAPIAHAFIGGTLLDPYFDAVKRTVELATEAARVGSNARPVYKPVVGTSDSWKADSWSMWEEGNATEGYAHVLTRHVGMTALMVFAAPSSHGVSFDAAAGTGVGLWRMGNKGAVAARLTVSHPEKEDTEITLVSAHLAPMEWNVARRKRDFEHIVSDLVFEEVPRRSGGVGWDTESPWVSRGYGGSDSEDEDATPLLGSSIAKQSYDTTDLDSLRGIYDSRGLVVFAGDLNYRTSDTGPRISDHATFPQPTDGADTENHFLNLLKHDQLTRELKRRRSRPVFQEFAEAPITFPPTYKYRRTVLPRRGEEDKRWAWAWHRWPSWCDRVLYLPSAAVEVLGYAALPIQPTSDHRPVALALVFKNGTSREQFLAPVPLNRHAVEERAAAKGREFAVGFLAYLALTYMGNAILVCIAAGGLAFWYLMHRLVLA
jgi:hypothetical protein